MKNIIYSFIIGLVVVFLPLATPYAFAAENGNVVVYFFRAEGCPHCADEAPFLDEMAEKYDEVEIRDYEITSSKENALLLVEVAEKLNFQPSGVPVTVIGDEYFVGWLNEETSGTDIENAIRCAIDEGCENIAENIVSDNGTVTENYTVKDTENDIPGTISLPIFGEISTKSLSLPIITLLVAAVDGFNPCAMWVLLFLISLLIGMKDRKKMWTLGIVFIIASAAVYFVFMSAWLNLLLFIGMVVWIRVLIGLFAVGAGGWSVREYYVNPPGTCKVTQGDKKQKTFDKIKSIINEKNFIVSLIGIIILAAAVNLVELICSAGLPAVYTQVLSLSDLSGWGYSSYLLMYVFIFMLDDIIVFIIAMIALKATGLTTKYSHITKLIGGIIMIIIGVLLLFKPEWLMFG